MYAINVADLTALAQSPEHVALLLVLGQHIDRSRVVECERGKVAGVGVLFTCADEQVVALVELIRDRLKKYALRIYQKGKSWKRV